MNQLVDEHLDKSVSLTKQQPERFARFEEEVRSSQMHALAG